jgi:hypothetical protein
LALVYDLALPVTQRWLVGIESPPVKSVIDKFWIQPSGNTKRSTVEVVANASDDIDQKAPITELPTAHVFEHGHQKGDFRKAWTA